MVIPVSNFSGNIIRTSGDIVFDEFKENDPVQLNMRSQARYAFVPGDIDHTARSTGTFDES